MINKPSSKDLIALKPLMKRWLQTAKRNKCVYVLYKADNVLKNTPGYTEEGLLKLVRQCHINTITDYNSPADTTKANGQITNFKYRFSDRSLKDSLSINYWKEKIK